MTARPALRQNPDSPLHLVRWERPEPDKYRTLFRRVGGPWLWFSRLVMAEADLLAIIRDPDVAVFAVVDGRRIGEIGRAHVCTPVTNAPPVCPLLPEKKKRTEY